MSPATQPESKAATLMRRLASSVVLLGVVFYGLLAGGPISLFLVGGLIMLLNVAGLLEFYGMVNANGLPRFKWLGLAGGVTLVGTLFVYLSGLAKQQLGENHAVGENIRPLVGDLINYFLLQFIFYFEQGCHKCNFKPPNHCVRHGQCQRAKHCVLPGFFVLSLPDENCLSNHGFSRCRDGNRCG